jgi:D-alanine-D-alanine ligase
MPRKTALILCGGRSAEREVSLVSSSAVLGNLPKEWKPLLVWIDPAGRWFFQSNPKKFAAAENPVRFKFAKTPARLDETGALVAGRRRFRFDACFPVLHGPFGEDGTMQGLLDLFGVAFVGSDALGSSVGMDKDVTKRLARDAGLPVLPYAVLHAPGELWKTKELRYPLFVKPARLGSAVGVYKVKRKADLPKAVRRAFRYDTKVLVEQGLEARELECAVLGRTYRAKASGVGEIRPRGEFYSYEAKYEDPDGAELLIPARASKSTVAEIRTMSLLAFETLCLDGLARVDFFADKKSGKVWFNEVNTIPGFTAISMYPKLWRAAGVSFPKLLGRLLSLAVERRKERDRLRITRD